MEKFLEHLRAAIEHAPDEPTRIKLETVLPPSEQRSADSGGGGRGDPDKPRR